MKNQLITVKPKANLRICYGNTVGSWFLINFGLKTSLVLLDPLKNNGRQVHRFTVKSESYSAFYNLVNPYIEQLVKEVGTIDKDQFLKRKVLPKPSKT